MSTSRKPLILAVLAIGIAVAAVGSLVAAIINDSRRTSDDCLAVDSTLVDLIVSRSPEGSVPHRAAAIEDPFARGRRSVSYDRYYIVVLELPAPGASSVVGTWGLGTNTERPEDDSPLSESGPVDGQAASLAAIDVNAEQWANWPNLDIPIADTDPMVEKARDCLGLP